MNEKDELYWRNQSECAIRQEMEYRLENYWYRKEHPGPVEKKPVNLWRWNGSAVTRPWRKRE
jgi:hypothetical protein